VARNRAKLTRIKLMGRRESGLATGIGLAYLAPLKR
jgi:hypothetical protein